MAMHVAEVWRYPVKSMAGERLDVADVGAGGISGDRVVHVENARGRLITARSHPALLGFHARLGADGEPLIDGRAGQPRRWPPAFGLRSATAPTWCAMTGSSASTCSRCWWRRTERSPRSGWIADGCGRTSSSPGWTGLAEREWPGRRLRIGSAVIRAAKLRRRCVMTTYDPDTLDQDLRVLERIADEFDGRMALDCEVLEGGRVAVGDPVVLED